MLMYREYSFLHCVASPFDSFVTYHKTQLFMTSAARGTYFDYILRVF